MKNHDLFANLLPWILLAQAATGKGRGWEKRKQKSWCLKMTVQKSPKIKFAGFVVAVAQALLVTPQRLFLAGEAGLVEKEESLKQM